MRLQLGCYFLLIGSYIVILIPDFAFTLHDITLFTTSKKLNGKQFESATIDY